MKKFVIIVAGGSGLRMGSDIPKQFIQIKGIPILMHTIRRFFNYDPNINIVLALPAEHIVYWKTLCEDFSFGISHSIVKGGSTRFYSVKNAVDSISNEYSVIAIHDGVRPLVSLDTISECFKEAADKGTAIPVLEIVDSIREIKSGKSTAVDRKNYRIVQTPQVFRSTIIKKAYHQAYRPEFTDDATVVESSGTTVFLTNGNMENIKITTPSDLKYAELFL